MVEDAINIMRIQKFSWRGGQRYFVRVRVRRTVERSRIPPEDEERVETMFVDFFVSVDGNWGGEES